MSYLFPTYSRWEIEPEHAEGTYLISKDGKKYLDFTSGIGVCNLGHCPENVKKAIQSQLNKFWHVSNLFQQSEQEKAGQMLAKAAGMDAVFFANSGAEANEAAIKLAKKATQRDKVITFQQSFHGRTYGAMAATGQEKVKIGFGTMLPTFVSLPFNDIKALQNEMNEEVAAVMLEVVQGEGGIHIADADFLDQIQSLCKECGSLLIIDEIQTGIGRTGKPFAFQHFGMEPDIVTVAKGLGNGLPIGAVIGTERLKAIFGPGSHGSTFGGNPVSIAAAIATMEEIFESAFLRKVEEKSAWLFDYLESSLIHHASVKAIRGLGMMMGIEITVPNSQILSLLRTSGLIVLPAGEKVIRLLPPLTATRDELKDGIEIMIKVFEEFKEK
ncbi:MULTISPECIES: acetylornithine transaminase [unclassified Bacillus (in: firmicutes)]|uniref:acetylornithine transaminase n=1 Tax=unclassified Bacillus (in: firmicutes) TaxID=185979 RepID=UPI0008EB3455|nr:MULTISPECIES: acetylornithine transaminase [unclassified Bacillus (in: firmicutes)]SFA78849.1 acetylornithine aminotransferase apoenzyme [Bacillus sp. UNCCL13]SFQ68778.1 acetylornithine aminotransferase apoenzyme [Bacillus sp. cl95]